MEQNKLLKDYTIREVITHPYFFENMTALLNELWQKRAKARAELKPGESLRAHPIEELVKRDKWEPGIMSVMYAEVMDGKSKENARVRHFIRDCGNEVFNKTVKRLIDEEKENNPTGEDM